MKTTVGIPNTPEQNRFTGPVDFKWSMTYGDAVEFLWNGKHYSIVRFGRNKKIMLCEAYKPETEVLFETADDALDHRLDGERLRDIITKITVLYRTL